MLKVSGGLISAAALVLGQLLFIVPCVRADESGGDASVPPTLQGIVSKKTDPPAPLAGGASVQANPSTPGHFLFGGVERKVTAPLPASIESPAKATLIKETAKLAPVPDQVHNLTAEQDALASGDNQIWFRIPAWLAGKWKTQDRQLISEINYRNGKQNPPRPLSFGYCGEQFGLQQDKNGTCWQFEKVGTQPINCRVDKKGMAHFDVVESHKPISSSDTQLVLKKIWKSVTMNPDTQEVINERRFASTLTFSRLDESSMKVTETSETFDAQGTPISMKLIETARVKVAPFQPVANFRGNDMRTLFSKYMVKHRMGDLVAAKE
jgi:hypothetical protein